MEEFTLICMKLKSGKEFYLAEGPGKSLKWVIDKTEAIGRLRYEKPNLQIAFRTDKALTYLHFEGSEQL